MTANGRKLIMKGDGSGNQGNTKLLRGAKKKKKKTLQREGIDRSGPNRGIQQSRWKRINLKSLVSVRKPLASQARMAFLPLPSPAESGRERRDHSCQIKPVRGSSISLAGGAALNAANGTEDAADVPSQTHAALRWPVRHTAALKQNRLG